MSLQAICTLLIVLCQWVNKCSPYLGSILLGVLLLFVVCIQRHRKALSPLPQAMSSYTYSMCKTNSETLSSQPQTITMMPQLSTLLRVTHLTMGLHYVGYLCKEHFGMQMMGIFTWGSYYKIMSWHMQRYCVNVY